MCDKSTLSVRCAPALLDDKVDEVVVADRLARPAETNEMMTSLFHINIDRSWPEEMLNF